METLENNEYKGMSKIDWQEYFMTIVDVVAKRATCDRGHSGCVITTSDNRILTTGYVGAPSGLPHCDDVGHLLKNITHEDGRTSTHCVRTIHAEQNAILQAARHGTSLKGSILYCTMEPCRTCAMMIASVGIVKVVAKKKYHQAQESRAILHQAGIVLEVCSDSIAMYDDQ